MYRRQLLSVVGVAATASVAGCNGAEGPENGTPTEEDDEENEERALRIVDHELVREADGTEEETVAIEGAVAIVGDAEPSYIEVQGRFYDEEEELLDSTIERIEEIAETGPMSFRIEFPHVGERAAAVNGYDVQIATTL